MLGLSRNRQAQRRTGLGRRSQPSAKIDRDRVGEMDRGDVRPPLGKRFGVAAVGGPRPETRDGDFLRRTRTRARRGGVYRASPIDDRIRANTSRPTRLDDRENRRSFHRQRKIRKSSARYSSSIAAVAAAAVGVVVVVVAKIARDRGGTPVPFGAPPRPRSSNRPASISNRASPARPFLSSLFHPASQPTRLPSSRRPGRNAPTSTPAARPIFAAAAAACYGARAIFRRRFSTKFPDRRAFRLPSVGSSPAATARLDTRSARAASARCLPSHLDGQAI